MAAEFLCVAVEFSIIIIIGDAMSTEQCIQQVKSASKSTIKNQNFMTEEYKTLREEIKATKDRIFKIAGLSAVGMPSSYFLSHNNELEILRMFLPLLIFAVMMLYLSESISLMRCGRYIKECIEPVARQGENNENFNKWKGWECWLEEKDRKEALFIKNTKRSAERTAAFFFYIFFITHYIASVILSVETFYNKFQDAGWYCSITGWSIVGIAFFAYFFIIFPKSISTTA